MVEAMEGQNGWNYTATDYMVKKKDPERVELPANISKTKDNGKGNYMIPNF